MLELLNDYADFIYDGVADVGIGTSVWLVALVLPFRPLIAKKEFGWDVIGYFGSALSGILVVALFEDPFLDWSIGHLADWRDAFDALPWYVSLPIYIVVADFGMYWSHRALHTVLLWDSHAWHHSSQYLYFLSGTRATPVHVFFIIAPTTLAYLFFPYPTASLIFTLHVGFQIANEHYIHSNLWVPFPRQLELVFVTPRAHFVHHSRKRSYADTNYGFIFSIWDRMFGTWTDPDTVPSDEPLGLSYEIDYWRAFLGLGPQRSTGKQAQGDAA